MELVGGIVLGILITIMIEFIYFSLVLGDRCDEMILEKSEDKE